MHRLMLSIATLLVLVVILEVTLRLAGLAMVRFAVEDHRDEEQGPVILCIGDSFTMGGLSTFDSSYPVQLGELFLERHPDAGIQVVNLGRAGSNTAQMLRNLKRGIKVHHPEFVVVLGGWNNFRNFYGFRQPSETGGQGLGMKDFILDLRVYKLVLMASERLRGVGPKPLDDATIERQSAKVHLEETRRLTSDSSGNLERGMELKEAGEIDLAIACFVDSIKANPTDPRGYRQVTKTIRDPEVARQFFAARVQDLPDEAWPLVGLSLVHRDQKRFEEARACLERVVTADPALREYVDDSLHLLDRDRARAEISLWIDLDLADMQRLCEANEAMLVIQNYPLGDFPMLERFARREKLPFANHLGAFDSIPESDRDMYFLPGDFHPNAQGNGIMAETLYHTLTGTGLIRKVNPDDA